MNDGSEKLPTDEQITVIATGPLTTMIGALTNFVSNNERIKKVIGKNHFQPMPANFGLLPEMPKRIKNKRDRYGAYRDRALTDLEIHPILLRVLL